MRRCLWSISLAIAVILGIPGSTVAQSLFQRSADAATAGSAVNPMSALYPVSMFAIKPPEPHVFKANDLVTIIVRENNKVQRTQDLETTKEYTNELSLLNKQLFDQFLQFRLPTLAATSSRNHKLADVTNEFTGEGDYSREDKLDARVTARILEVKPNGTLLLEARSSMTTDNEIQNITLSGLCRSVDITGQNTVLSTQLFNLNLNIQHEGELRKVNKKGVLTKLLETIFNF
jgi:flagellar L-ring protein FlgH